MFPEALREIEDNPDIRTREQLSEMDREAAEQAGLEQPPEIKPEEEPEQQVPKVSGIPLYLLDV